ncbi:MAG: hypothetical protein ACRDSJ_16520 [Rubrobacteraceae bacterium]
MRDIKHFCRIVARLREAEEAVRILQTHERAGLLAPERRADLERHMKTVSVLEPIVIGYYGSPQSMPSEARRA